MLLPRPCGLLPAALWKGDFEGRERWTVLAIAETVVAFQAVMYPIAVSAVLRQGSSSSSVLENLGFGFE